MERGWEDVQRQGQDLARRFAALAHERLSAALQNNLSSPSPSPPYPSTAPASQLPEHRLATSTSDHPLSSGECCEHTVSPSWPWPWISKPPSKFSSFFFSKIQVNDRKSRTPENCKNTENDEFDCARITSTNGSNEGEEARVEHCPSRFTIKKSSRKENSFSMNHEQERGPEFTDNNRSQEKIGSSKSTSGKSLNIDKKKSMQHISAHTADESGSKKEKKSSMKNKFTDSVIKKISNREKKESLDSSPSTADFFPGEKMIFMNHDMHEIKRKFSQARAELGTCINGLVDEFTKYLSLPFQGGKFPSQPSSYMETDSEDDYLRWKERNHDNATTHPAKSRCAIRNQPVNSRHNIGDQTFISEENNAFHDCSNEELFGLFINRQSQLYRQGSVNVSTIYDSRTREIESSVTARGDLWRAEATHGRNNSANGSSPLFLLQIGPILFVRDSTLLLPIHLSKQHLLWYGFDRKNGVHSICPAMWSKRRRWLVMSMICLNPFNCSFMDIQFPNGQLTYVAGEGITSSAFFPILGGLLQAQCAHPDVIKLSFSKKMWWGSRVTPSIQFPERALSVDVLQPLAWQRSGMMVRPTVELRVTPTLGGRNAGWKAEFVHSPIERLSWSCGCILTIEPTAYASISLTNAKRNSDDFGRAGLVLRIETPVENPTQASFQIQLNSGVEF